MRIMKTTETHDGIVRSCNSIGMYSNTDHQRSRGFD